MALFLKVVKIWKQRVAEVIWTPLGGLSGWSLTCHFSFALFTGHCGCKQSFTTISFTPLWTDNTGTVSNNKKSCLLIVVSVKHFCYINANTTDSG